MASLAQQPSAGPWFESEHRSGNIVTEAGEAIRAAINSVLSVILLMFEAVVYAIESILVPMVPFLLLLAIVPGMLLFGGLVLVLGRLFVPNL